MPYYCMALQNAAECSVDLNGPPFHFFMMTAANPTDDPNPADDPNPTDDPTDDPTENPNPTENMVKALEGGAPAEAV